MNPSIQAKLCSIIVLELGSIFTHWRVKVHWIHISQACTHFNSITQHPTSQVFSRQIHGQAPVATNSSEISEYNRVVKNTEGRRKKAAASTCSWPESCSCFFCAQSVLHQKMRWCHCCEWRVSSLWRGVTNQGSELYHSALTFLFPPHEHITRTSEKLLVKKTVICWAPDLGFSQLPTLYGFSSLGICGCQKVRGCSVFYSLALKKGKQKMISGYTLV